MIGLRVKACFFAMFALGCSAKTSVTKEPAPVVASMPAGAEGWQDGALLLPAGSPAVFSARLDVVLDAVTRLKAWVIAEPAMLGPDGPQTARTIESGWIAATAYLGVDPLLPRAWTERGVDPGRRFYVGMYPVQRDGRRFVSSVETVIRDELGIAPGDPVSSSMQMLSSAGGQLPEGTHARIMRALADTKPIGGMRVVIPVTDSSEFLITLSSFAEGMGFLPFGDEHGGDGSDHRFWADGGAVPAMAVRFAGGFAVIDLLFPEFVGGPLTAFNPKVGLAMLHANLGRALEEVAPGRPRAPAPVGAPAVSISFDQSAMGEFVRLRGYRRGLQDLHATSTGRRDAELLDALVSTVSESDSWGVGAATLTGTTFQVSVEPAGAGALGKAQMLLFARQGLTSPDTSRELPTLDLSRRSAGLGVDLATLRSSSWRDWFAGKSADQFNALEFTSMRPAQTLLPGVRAATVALSSLGDPASASSLSEDLGETLQQLEHVQRFEVVGLAPDVSEMQQHPEVLCAVVLGKDAPKDAVPQLQAALAAVMLRWTDPDAELPAMAPVTPGVTSNETLGSLDVRQHLLRTAEGHQVMLFGVGVPAESFEEEIAPLAVTRSLHGAVHGRLEPIALLSWLRDGDSELLDPIDVDILAQRLGALTLKYHSLQVEQSHAMSLELQLSAPPRL